MGHHQGAPWLAHQRRGLHNPVGACTVPQNSATNQKGRPSPSLPSPPISKGSREATTRLLWYSWGNRFILPHLPCNATLSQICDHHPSPQTNPPRLAYNRAPSRYRSNPSSPPCPQLPRLSTIHGRVWSGMRRRDCPGLISFTTYRVATRVATTSQSSLRLGSHHHHGPRACGYAVGISHPRNIPHRSSDETRRHVLRQHGCGHMDTQGLRLQIHPGSPPPTFPVPPTAYSTNLLNPTPTHQWRGQHHG